MGGMSRNKGKCGERELARLLSDLTGYPVARRVRNLAGEDDLQGLPGWSIECKRYAAITPALIAGWWAQAQRQAQTIGQMPVLFYRADRGDWMAVWPVCLHIGGTDTTDHLTATPSTWWAMTGDAV
ncbi:MULTISPECIES: putative PDDEXK endonuclease [Giesbergeria]|uniref:Holliday junction resolvase n=1 Tax=Giesbergeria sinuosa TaxID=80883 RepID=A0ABV9QBY2_9BURK